MSRPQSFGANRPALDGDRIIVAQDQLHGGKPTNGQ